jgi:hypothetical protein
LKNVQTSVLFSFIFKSDCFIHLIIAARDISISSIATQTPTLILKMNVTSAKANISSRSKTGETNIEKGLDRGLSLELFPAAS